MRLIADAAEENARLQTLEAEQNLRHAAPVPEPERAAPEKAAPLNEEPEDGNVADLPEAGADEDHVEDVQLPPLHNQAGMVCEMLALRLAGFAYSQFQWHHEQRQANNCTI